MVRDVAISTVKIVVYFGLLLIFSIAFLALIAPMLGVSFDDIEGETMYRGMTGIVIGGGLLVSALVAAAMMIVSSERQSAMLMGKSPGPMVIDLSLGAVVGVFVILAGLAAAVFLVGRE